MKGNETGVNKLHSWTIGLLLAAVTVCPAQVTFTEYPVPTTDANLNNITTGPDGNLWFTDNTSVWRCTPAGVLTRFPVPSGSTENGITAGPDGNVWFVEYRANSIGRITPAGVVTEFVIPTGGSYPVGITLGPDGNLWFTESIPNQIGRITTAGVITEFSIPIGGPYYGGIGPSSITKGPDGNLWITAPSANLIVRMTPTGSFTGFPVPTSGGYPYGITAGPDGNLWFAEANSSSKIARITPTGVFTEFPVPTSNSSPVLITTGPDDNLWFTEQADQIGRITTAGTIAEFPVPTSGSSPYGITLGADGNLWFTEGRANNIVKVTLGPRYKVCLLYDPTKAKHSGSTIPIKLQLCDGSGNDLSSSSITVHALSVIQVSTLISGPVDDSGDSNPDNDFRFDSSLGSTGGYIFNLKTTGLTTGTYNLNFTVTGDSFVYAAPFQVK